MNDAALQAGGGAAETWANRRLPVHVELPIGSRLWQHAHAPRAGPNVRGLFHRHARGVPHQRSRCHSSHCCELPASLSHDSLLTLALSDSSSGLVWTPKHRRPHPQQRPRLWRRCLRGPKQWCLLYGHNIDDPVGLVSLQVVKVSTGGPGRITPVRVSPMSDAAIKPGLFAAPVQHLICFEPHAK